jgi:hypothetical protein
MILQLQKRVSAIFSEVYYALTREKPQCSGGKKNLSQCHFVYKKSNIDWPGIEAGYRGEKPGISLLSHCKANFVLRRQDLVNHLGLSAVNNKVHTQNEK